MYPRRIALFLLAALAIVAAPNPALAQPCPPDQGDACPVELEEREAGREPESAGTLLYFWGVGCRHCEEARPFVDALAHRHPGLEVKHIEVRQDAAGRRVFLATAEELGITAPGIPTFVYGDRYVVGFRGGESELAIERMVAGGANDTFGAGAESVGLVELPFVGAVDARQMPLPAFTLLIGLIDGINPCAMWVLMVLLSILLHVRERRRLLLFGGIFVVMSGVVYFLFMTVWVSLFELVGVSGTITRGLGALVLGMGLINLKELLWFKKGVSLTIPERVKPTLYRRMRGIARASRLPAAIAGVMALAFLVNLVELGCTLGLPAIYTRVLSLRADLAPATRYAYLVLYNAAYVVPLAAIVGVYVLTMRRMELKERGAKILKAVSGALLVVFGLAFLLAPGMLN
jgi:hypothetical protein